MMALAMAFLLAVYSSVFAQEGRLVGTAICASLALFLAGYVALTAVPYLARRTSLEWLRVSIEYRLTREGKFFIVFIFILAIAGLNTGNNLLYLILASLLAAILMSGVLSLAVLTGVEAKLVEILQKHGPVMERGALEELCVASGVNRFSFHAFVACSPVIAQYGHSVYGLLGADVSAETVKSLVARRWRERAPTRVLHSHGRTDDGKLWLSYRLSRAASTYAVITVPAALKDLVSGRFRLYSAEGRHVGTLAAKDGRAWGVGAFLRQTEARIDDSVVITIDLDQRTAVIAVGEGPATP